LRLRQQLAALETVRAELLDLSIPAKSEEDQEIEHIQTMIQNSPDLINAPGKDGNTHSIEPSLPVVRATGFLLDHGAALDRSAC